MTPLHAQRFFMAADVLRRIDPYTFDIKDYGSQTHCGTRACIAGHCALSPEFVAAGFAETEWTSEGSLYPREGTWGEAIKAFFGPSADHGFVIPIEWLSSRYIGTYEPTEFADIIDKNLFALGFTRPPRNAREAAERFLHAARVIRNVPYDQFNLDHYGVVYDSNDDDCGTRACIAGHASLDPWFRERGFNSTLINIPASPSKFLAPQTYEETESAFSLGDSWNGHIRSFFGPKASDTFVVPGIQSREFYSSEEYADFIENWVYDTWFLTPRDFPELAA